MLNLDAGKYLSIFDFIAAKAARADIYIAFHIYSVFPQ